MSDYIPCPRLIEQYEQEIARLRSAMKQAHAYLRDIHALASRGLLCDSRSEGDIRDLARAAGKLLGARHLEIGDSDT